MAPEPEAESETDLPYLTDPSYIRWMGPFLILIETVSCAAIIMRVAYTEIDWETYMTQVHTFLPVPGSAYPYEPELDYSKLSGPTGPLVYPAIHLYLHTILYYITGHGENIQLAQQIYAGVYLITLALVIACYRRAGTPPWVLLPLIFSKRLHSIFLLRLFNDCWVALCFWLAVYALQRRYWIGATIAWTIGLGVKMTMLLTLPGLALILVQGAGMEWAVFALFVGWLLQFGSALPFLGFKVHASIYLTRAFDFSRVFLYKWTVNWKCISEETFLSKEFAIGLIVLHVVLLALFTQALWIRPSRVNNIWEFALKYWNYMSMTEQEEEAISKKVTPLFVMDTMTASMVIGLLCARSLHYQFYAYLFWCTPYLLWRLQLSWLNVFINTAIQEYAWMTYPSTETSSTIVVAELVLQVFSALIRRETEQEAPQQRAAAVKPAMKQFTKKEKKKQ